MRVLNISLTEAEQKPAHVVRIEHRLVKHDVLDLLGNSIALAFQIVQQGHQSRRAGVRYGLRHVSDLSLDFVQFSFCGGASVFQSALFLPVLKPGREHIHDGI